MSDSDSQGSGDRSGVAIERASDCEVVITRTVKGPARLVFEAWADPALFRRWWAPASFGIAILSYDADVRTGGTYRLVMHHPAADQPLSFFGRYIEVTPPTRIVWTNDEDAGGGSITTVTFEARGDETLVVVTDRYPTPEALDEAVASGATSGWGEQLGQLEALVADMAG